MDYKTGKGHDMHRRRSKIDITILTSTEYFTNGVSNRRYQGKCTSIQPQVRKKKISNKIQGDTGHSTRRIYNSITR
jgi:hypothetical protein